jgi:hypothetical protein
MQRSFCRSKKTVNFRLIRQSPAWPWKGMFPIIFHFCFLLWRIIYRLSPLPWFLVTYPYPVRLAWPLLHTWTPKMETVYFENLIPIYKTSRCHKPWSETWSGKLVFFAYLWKLYNEFSWSTVMGNLRFNNDNNNNMSLYYICKLSALCWTYLRVPVTDDRIFSCGCLKLDFYWTCWTLGYKWGMLSFGT